MTGLLSFSGQFQATAGPSHPSPQLLTVRHKATPFCNSLLNTAAQNPGKGLDSKRTSSEEAVHVVKGTPQKT